jgi:hypothetical protein
VVDVDVWSLPEELVEVCHLPAVEVDAVVQLEWRLRVDGDPRTAAMSVPLALDLCMPAPAKASM